MTERRRQVLLPERRLQAIPWPIIPEEEEDTPIRLRDKPRSGLYLLIDSIRSNEARRDGGRLAQLPLSEWENGCWCLCDHFDDTREDGLYGDDLGELGEVLIFVGSLLEENGWDHCCEVNQFHFNENDDVDVDDQLPLHGLIVGLLELGDDRLLVDGETLIGSADSTAAPTKHSVLRSALENSSPFFEIRQRCFYFIWETRPSH